MTEKDQINRNIELAEESEKPEKTNESTGIYVRGFVRITDPETGKVIVETAK
jgi:hypothetical protein